MLSNVVKSGYEDVILYEQELFREEKGNKNMAGDMHFQKRIQMWGK